MMAGEYLCNLVVPGAGKSGTTALHDILDGHPQVQMSSSKEPHFFCLDERFKRGPEYHNALFDASDSSVRIYGESSTGYLVWPQAVERIKHTLERPKIIIVLRDPIGRTVSHYRWRFRLGLEKRDLLSALREDGYGFDPERPAQFGYMAYLQFSHYATYCPMWLDAFGRENCLVIASNGLRSDFKKTAVQIAEFLELDDSAELQPLESYRTDELATRPAAMMTKAASILPRSWKNKELYHSLREKFLRLIAPTPPDFVSEEARDFLQKVLAEDICFFNAAVGEH
jgi:hypothetical protein